MKQRHRLLWILLLGGAVGVLLASTTALFLLRQVAERRGAERLRAEVALVAQWAEDPAAVADAQAFTARVARRLGLRVTVISAQGVVLGDSSRDAQSLGEMENHLGRPEIREARLR